MPDPSICDSVSHGPEKLTPCAFSPACGLWCVLDFDGFFKQVNVAVLRLLGWTTGELLARPFIEFVHPDDRAITLAELLKLEGGRGPVDFQHRFAHREGSYRWLHWTLQPVAGQPIIQASARDITAQRHLEKEIMEISDREKDRLGRDLHDGLCQKLAGIAALSTSLSRRLGSHSEFGAAAAEIASLLTQTIIKARNLARGLNPVNLDGSGLIGALDAFAVNTQAMFAIPCIFRCNRSTLWLGADVETHLYRIAQEAVQNAVSHGRAGRISLTLSLVKGRGTLVIRDNGIGIKADYNSGNGMHTMDYRARLIGASLSVLPGYRNGTRVACAFSRPATLGTNHHD